MREIIDLCDGWLFHRGDIKNDLPAEKNVVYEGAKTESAKMGPAFRNYKTALEHRDPDVEYHSEKWDRVTLPHDYIVGGIPEEKYNCGLGFFKYDNAWYIKRITATEDDLKKRNILCFEGVATHCEVWLNGCLLKRNFSGYTPFEVDLSDYLRVGENAIAVYVNTESHEGWWYEGGGIYRPVTLIRTDLVSVERRGIFVHPEKKGDGWSLPNEITLRNDGTVDRRITVRATVTDGEGGELAAAETDVTIGLKDKKTLALSFGSVLSPALWSPDEPNLYRFTVSVWENGEEIDTDSVRFGFRTFRLDPERGFFINDRHYKIKGVCGHADCGLFGKAVPDNIHRYKVDLMREMGANGYRTSHYPQSDALMDALDEAGFIVMDEVRDYHSTEEGLARLETLIRRDRNHPSVFFWSLGNEEPYHTTEQGRKICQSMIAFARRLDPTRCLMTAVDKPIGATVYDLCDVIGVNYNLESYDELHRRFPDKNVFASECCATGTTRGWYFGEDPTRAYLPAYDRDTNAHFLGREHTWKFLDERDWILGGYQWIAFEHRGEATWPRLCSQSGAIDLFMQKKDAFFQNQSFWSEKPMIHILPHWNFAGLEGEKITVWVYTNQREVELFLNGKTLGRQTPGRYGHGCWEVPYERGELTAIGYEDGRETVRETRKTSGKPAALVLTQDNEIEANGRDFAIVTCSVVDVDGIEVPDAGPTVRFFTSGDCRVHSTGSDISDHTSLFSPERKMRAGRIGVAVRIGREPGGERKLYASAEGLPLATLNLKVKES